MTGKAQLFRARVSQGTQGQARVSQGQSGAKTTSLVVGTPTTLYTTLPATLGTYLDHPCTAPPAVTAGGDHVHGEH